MDNVLIVIRLKTIFWYFMSADFVINPFILAKELKEEIGLIGWKRCFEDILLRITRPRLAFQQKLILLLKSFFCQSVFFKHDAMVIIIKNGKFSEEFAEYLKQELGLDPANGYHRFMGLLFTDIQSLSEVKNTGLNFSPEKEKTKLNYLSGKKEAPWD